MNILIITAAALFLNANTGEQQIATQQVDSLTECATLINANRIPKVIEEGEYAGTWYMVKSNCSVQSMTTDTLPKAR